jgi:hypothetical protein
MFFALADRSRGRDYDSRLYGRLSYRYKTNGVSVDLQFGAAVDAGTDRVLPLSFHSGKTRTLATFTPAPTATPTPVPAEGP